MEPKSSTPYSQQPATGPYPETVQFSPHTTSLKYNLMLSYHLSLGLSSGILHLGFWLDFGIHLSSSTHLILLDFIIL
jgi:hypothetical protein